MPDEQDAPIREFADRGTLWLLESPENLRGLLEIVAKEVADRLDFARAERQNRSFVPADLHKQEADVIYRVPFREGGSDAWIYVLLEQQSRPDRAMGLRLLSYMVELWKTQQRAWEQAKLPASQWQLYPVVPIVFYTGSRRWEGSLGLDTLMAVPPLLTEFLPHHKTLFLNLQAMRADRLTQTESPIAWALRVLRDAEEPYEVLSSVLERAVGYLETLPDEARAEWTRAMHYLLLLVRHKREPEERETLYNVVYESVDSRHRGEVEQMVITDAQVLVAQGRREGREEGRKEGHKEGHKEGRIDSLLEQMETKFGPLPDAVVSKVRALPEQKVTDLTKRILTAQSLVELGL